MKPRNKQSKSMKEKTTKLVKTSNPTVHTTKIVPTVFEDLFSREVWESTYKDHNDNSVDDTLLRVAKAVASVETTEPLRNEWTDKFYDMMQGFKVIPGGRILANAGTEWKGTTLVNCFSPEAKVLTLTGLKNINTVNVGDLVLTHRGRYRPVVNILTKPYSGSVERIKSSYLTEDITTTPEHPFYQGANKWELAEHIASIITPSVASIDDNEDIKQLDIAELLHDAVDRGFINVTDTTVTTTTSYVGGNGAKGVKKGQPVSRFINITENFAYLIGRFVGDGCTFKQHPKSHPLFNKEGFNVAFNATTEVEHASQLASLFQESFGITPNLTYSQNNTLYIRKASLIVSTVLERLLGGGFATKFIPTFVWMGSEKIKLSFLRGLYDADGFITSKGYTQIQMTNPPLIDEIHTMMTMVGMPCTKQKDRLFASAGTTFDFRTSLTKVYDDDRRNIKIGKRATTGPVRIQNEGYQISIERVQEHYEGIVYNLSVEEDESYVVNNAVVHNCYVSPRKIDDIDSLDGILHDLRNQSQTLKSEGGWGQNFSFIRPRGSFINGVGVETPGAVKFMELYDKASEIITSGSGRKSANKKSKGKIRKGAMMSVLDCSHPDIVEFVTAKQTPGRLTKFNVSVNCTDEFMKKVQDVAQMRKDGASEDKIAEMDKWELIFPETTFDKYKAEWDGDIQLWLSKKYPINVYDTVSASWLWNLIMESTYNRAEPGVLFLDRANHFNPLNYGEKIASTNPCITGDTWVATSVGLIKFEDLINNSKIKHCVSNHAPMRDGNDWKIEVRVPFVNAICNGVKDTIRLKYSNGMYIDCTPDHRIFTTEWYLPAAHCIGKQIRLVDTYSFGTEGEWCRTKNSSIFSNDENNLAFFLGCLTAFGQISGDIIGVRINDLTSSEKDKIIGIFNGWQLPITEGNPNGMHNSGDVTHVYVTSSALADYIYTLQTTTSCGSVIPEPIFKAPKHAIEQFLEGYHVPTNLKTSKAISSQLKNDLMQLSLMVGNIKELVVTITAIEQLSPQKVYDLTVPEFHNFVAGGITVHNCGEQMLAPGGICCLGSVNLVNFINDTRTDFDYQKLEKYTGYLVRFLDNVNSYSSAPLPEYKHSMKHKRRIGCGLMGWGSALLMLKTRYGSSKAADLRERVLKTFAHATYKTSVDLAEEKGKFSLCNPKKHAAGVFVGGLDLPEAYIQKMKKVGIRNSSLLSIQPNGNSSLFSNVVSGGLEPIFMHEYIRTVIVPTMPEHIKDVTPKWFEGEWKETSMFKFTKEGDEEILKGADKHGTTYKIDKNRGLTKEVLCEDYGVRHLKLLNEWDSNAQWAATTTQLTADDHLSELKGFARWIDSAISKTINVPHDYPLEDFKKIYLDAYNTGYIKGITTYRSGTMTTVLSAKEDKHADQNDEEIILEDVKLPASSQATLKVLKAEGKKWYLTVAYHEHNPNRPFALFVKTNAHEKNVVADGAIAELFALARIKKIPDRHINSVENKLATDNNSSKIARLISFLLRHGVLIKNIVSALDNVEDVYVGSFVFQIKKFLSSYIKDGEQVEGETCSECSGINTIVYREGCKICTNCSSSKCS